MANTNVQAIAVANNKLRPLADRFGRLYNVCKMLQAEYTAEGWATLFPNDSEILTDGSATDGRTPIANADIVTLMATVGAFITDMEASTSAKRNNVLKIAVSPELV